MEKDLVTIMKALANPHRLEMLRSIYETGINGDCEGSAPGVAGCSCVGDIVAGSQLAPSTISHYLKELSHAGLIRVERNGHSVRITPDSTSLESLKKFAEELLALT